MSEDEQIAATMDGPDDCPHPGDCTEDSTCPCFDDKPSRQAFRYYGRCNCVVECPCMEYTSHRAAKQAGH